MVFYGEYEVSITSSGRVALPKKIRDTLAATTVVVTKGFGECLAGYSKQDWEKRAETLLDVSLLDREQIDKRRILFSSTVHVELDDQGRIVLPKNLRTFAIRSKKVVITGVGDHFEIWDKTRWDSYMKEIAK